VCVCARLLFFRILYQTCLHIGWFRANTIMIDMMSQLISFSWLSKIKLEKIINHFSRFGLAYLAPNCLTSNLWPAGYQLVCYLGRWFVYNWVLKCYMGLLIKTLLLVTVLFKVFFKWALWPGLFQTWQALKKFKNWVLNCKLFRPLSSYSPSSTLRDGDTDKTVETCFEGW